MRGIYRSAMNPVRRFMPRDELKNIAYENGMIFNVHYYYYYYYRYFYHLLAPVFQNVVRSFLYISAGLLLLLFFVYENVNFNGSIKEKNKKKRKRR